MDNIHRREFTKQTSAIVGALFSGSLLDGEMLHAQEPTRPENAGAASNNQSNTKPDERLMRLGLNALARCHEMDYFADGHRGASLIAAHLMCADNEFDDPTRTRIVELFDLNWAPTALCKPFPDEKPDPDGITKIGEALADGGEVLRQVGHNAIFAMLAIKGFRMLPSAATPQRIDGVCKMIRKFTPWRDVTPDADVDPPPFSDSAAASKYVLQEASDAVDRWVGYGQGYTGHMLTFGQALVELAAMGDVEWADSCRTAFRKYVTVTRQGPDDEAKRYADHKPTNLRPDQYEYWKKRGDRTLGIGHVFKYPYSYYDLLERANDPALEREWDAKAYHVF